MPATDYLARSLLSIRRDQQHQIEPEPDAFQNRLADLFYDLAVSHSDKDQLLSIGWTRRLLEAFHICLEDFRAVVLHRRGEVAPPGPLLERLAAEFSDRSVRALDACNAAVNGIERLRQRQRLAQIVHVALASPRKQLQRAKKALSELAALMAEDKDDAGPTLPWHRHWPSHSRSHSWGGSSAWSAARQHIVDGGGGGGKLAAALCAMNWLLVFVGWALVAAVPGQDRSLQGQHLSFPRGLPWAAPAAILQERIAAESKKRRSTGSGLLREVQKMERCARQLAELEDETETEERVRELAQVCESMSEGLDPLERLVRTAFHEIVCSREETLTCLHHGPVD